MKPRRILAQTTLSDGITLELQEHDGRRYLVSNGIQISGPATKVSEHEMARLASIPFRPARQPRILLAGLGLGEVVTAIAEAVPQKRATFFVAEPSPGLVRWQREFFPDAAFATDKRVVHQPDSDVSGLLVHQGGLHAILAHADTVPLTKSGSLLLEDRRWLTAAHDALQFGGLLVVASSIRLPRYDRALARVGFKVAEEQIEANPGAKRPKYHFLWIARKEPPKD